MRKWNARKCWAIIKTVLYITIGVLIIVFRETALRHIPYLVGGVMLAYSLEDIAVCAVRRTCETEESSLFDGLVTVVLAIIMIFFASGDMTKYLVIWGVWSVLREGRELTEGFKHLRHKPLAPLDMLESVIVIVLSAILIVESVEHHARIHIVLLGIEMLLTVLFPVFNDLAKKIAGAYRAKKELPAQRAKDGGEETPAAEAPDGTESDTAKRREMSGTKK